MNENLDEEFARLSATVPGGFAGLYVDSAGRLVVLLTDVSLREAALANLDETLRLHTLGRFSPAVATNVRTKQALYRYDDLKRWRERIESEWTSLPGLVMTDINEVNNQIDLGFKEPDVAKPALAKLLLQSRIPVGAVRSLSWTEAPVTQTLDDFFPSIPGGVNAYAFGRGWCTAGINVLYNGVPALLTASHCGPMMGGMDGAAWGHGNSTTTLGWEIADPGSGCPFFQCRRSDVAVIQSSGGIPGELGMIARTTFVGAYPPVSNGSTTIDPNQPRFPLFWPGYPTSSPLMGEIMNKVGRATGWTSGPINKTCFTQQQTQTGWYMLCTYRFNGATTTGDSGAPVFHRLTCPGETWPAINCASFAGILWGGGDGHSYFSTTSNIRADFPNSSFVFVQ